MIDHLAHLALAHAKLFDDNADELFRAIDDQKFERFLENSRLTLAGQDFRLADLEFVTFTPHHFNNDGELQFAAAHHFKSVRAACLFHSDGDVGQELFVEPVAQGA